MDLQEAGEVRLEILDLHGRLVATVVEGWQKAGNMEVSWDTFGENGKPISPGTYLYRMVSASQNDAGRIVIVR
jgi:flagellar hook assembly protein FlgD